MAQLTFLETFSESKFLNNENESTLCEENLGREITFRESTYNRVVKILNLNSMMDRWKSEKKNFTYPQRLYLYFDESKISSTRGV